MITANNYFAEMQRVGVNNLPQTLKETHDYVVRATENGSSWDNYHNSEKIKRLIDLHFQKVNEFVSSQRGTKSSKSQSTSTSKSQKKDKEDSVFKKAFRLLNKFIPNLSVHLKESGKTGTLTIDGYGTNRIIAFWNGERNAHPEYDFILRDEVDGQQELQSDVTIYLDKKEAHVTADFMNDYYQDKYERHETEKEIEERDGVVGEVMTSTLVEWLEELLKENRQLKLEVFKAKKSTGKDKQNGTGRPAKSNVKERVEKKSKVKAKNVEHIREEVKFIKRFVSLHNKIKSPDSILAFIKSLQRAIVQKIIRKTSPLASEIMAIQDKLITGYNKMKGDESFRIKEDDLNKLVVIAGGERVYPSINIIKRYVGLQGKNLEGETIKRILRQMENALEKKKIAENDPYIDKVKAIYNSLKRKAIGEKLSIAKAELNGLAGIVNGCSCNKDLGKIYKTDGRRLRPCRNKSYSDASRGACSHNKGLSGVLTAEEMANRKLDLLKFFSFWLALFGMPSKNFTAMFHGEPHNGKTIFLLKLAQFLAVNFGNVLYVSSEEFASPTMTKKVSEFLNPFPKRLHFAENLNDPDISQYDFVILDSVNDLGLKINDYKEMRKNYPDTAFIFILQHTKSGDFKGGKDWEHTAEIVGEVHKGIVTVTKNRYAPKTSLDFFKHFGLHWQEADDAATLKSLQLRGDMVTTENENY